MNVCMVHPTHGSYPHLNEAAWRTNLLQLLWEAQGGYGHQGGLCVHKNKGG